MKNNWSQVQIKHYSTPNKKRRVNVYMTPVIPHLQAVGAGG